MFSNLLQPHESNRLKADLYEFLNRLMPIRLLHAHEHGALCQVFGNRPQQSLRGKTKNPVADGRPVSVKVGRSRPRHGTEHSPTATKTARGPHRSEEHTPELQ